MRARHDAGVITIVIEDDGDGMSAAQIERVAHPGLSENDGSQRVKAAYGLTAARSIARQHGGDLTITAQPGRGTTVTFDIAAR